MFELIAVVVLTIVSGSGATKHPTMKYHVMDFSSAEECVDAADAMTENHEHRARLKGWVQRVSFQCEVSPKRSA